MIDSLPKKCFKNADERIRAYLHTGIHVACPKSSYSAVQGALWISIGTLDCVFSLYCYTIRGHYADSKIPLSANCSHRLLYVLHYCSHLGNLRRTQHGVNASARLLRHKATFTSLSARLSSSSSSRRWPACSADSDI